MAVVHSVISGICSSNAGVKLYVQEFRIKCKGMTENSSDLCILYIYCAHVGNKVEMRWLEEHICIGK